MGKNPRVTSHTSGMSSFQNFFNEDFLLSSSLKPKNSSGSTESVSSQGTSSSSGAKENNGSLEINLLLEEPQPKRTCIGSDVKATSTNQVNPNKSVQNPPVPRASIATPVSNHRGLLSNSEATKPFEFFDINMAPKEPHAKRACITPDLKATINTLVNLSSSSVQSPPASQTNIVTSSPSPPPSISDQLLQVRIKLQIYQKEYAHFAECANRSSLQIQQTLEELHKLVNVNFDFEPSKSKIVSNEIPTSSIPVAAPIDRESVALQVPKAIVKTATPVAVTNEIIIKSVRHRPRVFPRKPRSLLFNFTQPAFSDTMLTSSLDGSVQIWSKNEQKIQSSIYLPSILHKPFFVEDLCWDRHPNGLLALGMCESAHAPVSDDSNGFSSNRSDKQIAFLQFDTADPYAAPRFITSNVAPHDRSVSVIESWSSPKHSVDTSYFLTGGLDKSIYSWKVVDKGNSLDPEISASELHRRHTSSVQAICYDWAKSDIWSGGTDCRLVQWSGEENRLVNELRWDSRISHLIKSQTHSNLMLATVTSMSFQLKLLDCRVNNIVHSFGTKETANLTRYARPSWHHNGNLIASGTLSPVDSIGSINIWDIRMMGGSSSNVLNFKPEKMINCEDKRLLRAEFAPDGRSLVGMSTDGSLTFVEFTC